MSNLKATKRESLSTGSTNKLRSEGFIPAILYGGKNPNLNISISKKEILGMINSDTFLSKSSVITYGQNTDLYPLNH